MSDAAAFSCTKCDAEFTASYTKSVCVDCGGSLERADGSPVRRSPDDDKDDAHDVGIWGRLEDDDDSDVLQPFATDNPWLQRIFESEGYGEVPSKAQDAFLLVSADGEERLIAALRTMHGKTRIGYLMMTTHWLRWIQTFPTRTDDFWSYDYPIEANGSMGSGGVIATVSGDQFQVRWGKAKSFAALYRLM
jgi:hypothetical protein